MACGLVHRWILELSGLACTAVLVPPLADIVSFLLLLSLTSIVIGSDSARAQVGGTLGLRLAKSRPVVLSYGELCILVLPARLISFAAVVELLITDVSGSLYD